MHTLPAAKMVGHDFLGNHIGELLIRQPVKKAAPAPRNKTSSNGSTVCGADSKTVRRASVVSQPSSSHDASMSNKSESQCAAEALDSFLSVGAITPLGISSDPIASLENSSESSASEPSSVDSRSGSADANLQLHLDQLSLSRKRIASEGNPTSPRVSFVTSFGAKPRRSGSRRAPSEAGSSSYFGMSSTMSSHMSAASLSPMEPSGGISWNLPFREQNQSFAQAVEHNASLHRHASQESSSSGAASSQLSKLPSTPDAVEPQAVTPTNASVEAGPSVKGKSFSGAGSSQPVRQRLTRAATESTLEPSAHMQQPLKSPGASSGLVGSTLSHSNSMGATTSALRTHRKKPSLVPKGDDERTFCFVDASSSDAECDSALIEEPVTSTKTTLPLERSASDSSYKDVVELQYKVRTRASSGPSAGCANIDEAAQAITPTAEVPNASGLAATAAAAACTPQDQQQEQEGEKSTRKTSKPVQGDQDTPKPSMFPLKPLSSASQNGYTRPVRRLRIQPNVQSRPSLLEKTMEEQCRASKQAVSANTHGVAAESESPAVTPSASERVPQSPGAKVVLADRYDPVAYGDGQRTFRIQSPAAVVGGLDFPFSAISSDEHHKRDERSNPPASHARTSDWARAQNLLASSQPAVDDLNSYSGSQLDGCVDMQAPCHSLTDYGAAGRDVPAAFARRHTESYSSESTDSPSILETRELLSPPETAISTPELESPPEHALHSLKASRRSSPLSS